MNFFETNPVLKVFNICSDSEFDEISRAIFNFQKTNNQVYRSFLESLQNLKIDLQNIEDFPCLPIQLFKSNKVYTNNLDAEAVFMSSGTTSNNRSKHYVADLKIYEESFKRGFKHFFGKHEDYAILSLLPSYHESGDSSLVYMMNCLMNETSSIESGFYLDDFDKLIETLTSLLKNNSPVLFMGVTYALLDFAENYRLDLSNCIVMETGGMKGRRKEILREEVHDLLKSRFSCAQIYSEYGMTELLSQAYSIGGGVFKCPPWMRVYITEVNDPFSKVQEGKTGRINIIDLANIYSCSFISTEDIGRMVGGNCFEVLGRLDYSDLRGCSLMY